jgi:hypothetical protein
MNLQWTGPFEIKDYLANAIDRTTRWKKRWPPDGDAVYLVSRHPWAKRPTDAAEPLYVGGNTGNSPRFCTRVGDLFADMFGFFGETGQGHHSGGQTLWKWCDANRVHPGDLWLGWTNSGCPRCVESFLFDGFPRAPKHDTAGLGLRNKIRPPRCPKH